MYHDAYHLLAFGDGDGVGSRCQFDGIQARIVVVLSFGIGEHVFGDGQLYPSFGCSFSSSFDLLFPHGVFTVDHFPRPVTEELVLGAVGGHEGGSLRHALPIGDWRGIFVVIKISVIEVLEGILVDGIDGLVGLGRIVGVAGIICLHVLVLLTVIGHLAGFIAGFEVLDEEFLGLLGGLSTELDKSSP